MENKEEKAISLKEALAMKNGNANEEKQEELKENESKEKDNTSYVVDTTKEDAEKKAKEELENKVIGKEGEAQLTVKELEQDKTTPGESMSNLKKFNAELDKEIEEAKAKKEQFEEEERNRLELQKIEERNKSKFNDEIIEDKEEVKKKEKENEKIPDLSSIKVRKTNDIDDVFAKEMKKRKAKAFTTKVVLTNSGYTASILGMSSPEIRNYSETMENLDLFGQMEYKYKNMFSKIESTSVGDMDYETFLKRTALMEYEILNFGLFSSSFPEKSTYPYKCSKCGARTDFVYYNKQFLDTAEDNPEKREKILSGMRKVLAGQAIDAKELFEQANTNNLIRKYLSHSKVIVELRHPTLYDELYDVLANISNDDIKEMNQAVVNIMPFIKTVYYPTDDTFNDDVPEYIQLDDLNKKIAVINLLDEKDDEDLAIEIQDKILSQYNIKFTIKAPKCVCGHQDPPEQVDFDRMLFMTHQIRISQN